MFEKVLFDTQHLYYLPQYLPVAALLKANGVKSEFVLYHEEALDKVKEKAITDAGFEYVYLEDKTHAFDFYQHALAQWIVFGNVPPFSAQQKNHITAKLALMQHGIGPKACYYDVSAFPFDVRFVEGQERLRRLSQQFPDKQFVDTGFAKLDPVFNNQHSDLQLSDLGLDPTKPTVLYAPTFFPSSIEHFQAEWPASLTDYNLIVKPHFFSLTKDRYKAHRKRFDAWAQFDNVWVASVAHYNLLPFMQLADVMLSDASSAIFEFAALNKPVIWCDFYQTRWSYKGLLKFRLKQRLDPDIELFHKLTTRTSAAKYVKPAIAGCLKHPETKQMARQELVNTMVGKTDGQCGARIAAYLTKHS
ncbi:CDP-glycerol--poly(glycerophosphate) glycerophosphotransferase [Salinimonas sp. HHU 13199]|uniref:CDP-glycerol--poly(Glycerophosphate) glycerophosphotransferase n=1 Tax=Salinimonas profundi TaxID=2729140 RepID=A0ABR8LPG4_9ALTE|nr:CDP-glycerol glycerophosphotransferase family protein [Salinimonas profundi]MBD3587632.1 CDP-glycerol--poly(glycerophosphate) glycerophosphotransferase [Salinimonas profundi]